MVVALKRPLPGKRLCHNVISRRKPRNLDFTSTRILGFIFQLNIPSFSFTIQPDEYGTGGETRPRRFSNLGKLRVSARKISA
jgi:hypothetical protein